MQIQYVILKVKLLSNKISEKKIEFSLEVHKTEISQMDLLSTMRQCVNYLTLFFDETNCLGKMPIFTK